MPNAKAPTSPPLPSVAFSFTPATPARFTTTLEELLVLIPKPIPEKLPEAGASLFTARI